MFIINATRKTMGYGRLVTETVEEIIPNGNTAASGFDQSTASGVSGMGGIGGTADNSYFMDSNLHGARDWLLSNF